MNKGLTNIDIVFRNGLKDYEVLPPPDVWDKIQPSIRTRRRPVVLLRTAALIAVLITVSFLANRQVREITTEPDNPGLSQNFNTSTPGNRAVADRIVSSVPASGSPSPVAIVENPVSEQVVVDIGDNAPLSTGDKIGLPRISLLPEAGSLRSFNADQEFKLPLMAINTLPAGSSDITNQEFEYDTESLAAGNISKWSVGAMASPTYYSVFTTGDRNISKQLSASEDPLISYSGGVSFSYKVSKRFSVQSGIYYSSLGQVVDGINSFGGFRKYDYTKGDRNFEVMTSSGTVYTNNNDVFLIANGPVERVTTAFTNDVFDPKKASLEYLSSTLRQNFSYLELPVVVRYKLIDRVFDFNLIGGLSYNMLVDNSVYAIVDGSKYSIGKTDGLNPVSFSSSLGMGMEYSFTKKLSLNLEPTFRYYMNPFNGVSGLSVHPYSFGIFSGISYKF